MSDVGRTAFKRMQMELKQLEQVLMDPDERRNRARLSELLEQTFIEHGQSGRVWTREAVLDLLETESAMPRLVMSEFAVRELGADVALVTYTCTRPDTGASTLRCSVWRRSEGRWRMVFHQGTRCAES